MGNYEDAIRTTVLKVKAGNEPLTAVVGALLAERLRPYGEWDVVMPIPIHWRRRVARTAVASEGLASEVASGLGIRLRLTGLWYRRLTRKQGTLTSTERAKNVQDSIGVKSQYVQGKRLLIVDDVLTSGATCNEAARVCRRAGAASVTVATIARGIGLSRIR